MFCSHLHGEVTGDDDQPVKSMELFGRNIFSSDARNKTFFLVSKLGFQHFLQFKSCSDKS